MYRSNRSYRNKLAEKRALESCELQRRVARLERLMYEDHQPLQAQSALTNHIYCKIRSLQFYVLYCQLVIFHLS